MSNKRRVRQHRGTRAGVRPWSPFAPDDDVIERIDGLSPKFVARGYQPRTGSTEPLPLSNMQLLIGIASSKIFWDLVADAELIASPKFTIGRPRQHNMAGLVLAEFGAWIFGSIRATFREFEDPQQWENLCRSLIKNHPTDKRLRLPPKPPSRSSYYTRRKKDLEYQYVVDQVRLRCTEFAMAVARHIGLFDITKGTMTHPDLRNVIYGDGTFIQSPFNELHPTDHVDPETGVITRRRCDPDATAWHQDGGTNGRVWVMASARNGATNERVILDLSPRPKFGTSDATVFTDMVLKLTRRLPAAQCAVYDMAFGGIHADQVLFAGLLPITKVALRAGSLSSIRQLGPHPFKTSTRTTEQLPIEAIGGTPAIFVVFEGERIQIDLEMRKLDREANRGDGYRIYGTWRIPDRPEVPRRLRGATTRIRHNSTKDEIAENRRRTRALRAIAPGTDAFNELFGIREDAESMHNHLKSRLINRRARSTGVFRQQLNLHAYQALTAIKALIAHSIRTGAPLDEFFGNWRPPDKT